MTALISRQGAEGADRTLTSIHSKRVIVGGGPNTLKDRSLDTPQAAVEGTSFVEPARRQPTRPSQEEGTRAAIAKVQERVAARKKDDERRFTSLQRRYIGLRMREDRVREELSRKYGPDYQMGWLTLTEQRKLESIRGQKNKLMDQQMTLLDRISPRGWRSGVPAWWVMEKLSFADATTRGQMSVVPPASYGSSEAASRAFAGPL
jgi:hypothetical protein